jgi:hypothetical protein
VVHFTLEQLILWYPNPPHSSHVISSTNTLRSSNMVGRVFQYISHLPSTIGGNRNVDLVADDGDVYR